MAAVINENAIPTKPCGVNAKRQRLLTEARVTGTRILLDRLTLGAGAVVELAVLAGSMLYAVVIPENGGGDTHFRPRVHVFFRGRYSEGLCSRAYVDQPRSIVIYRRAKYQRI